MQPAQPEARRRIFLTGLCCLCALLFADCRPKTAPPLNVRVTRLVISEMAAGDAPIADAELHAAAERGLHAAGVPVSEVNGETHLGDFQLRMQLQREERPNNKTVRMLCAGMLSARHTAPIDPPESGDAARTTPKGPELSKLEHVGVTEKSFASDPNHDDMSALAKRLVEDTAKTLGEQVQLLSQESRALVAMAGKSDSDPEVRKTAIEILGQRKEKLAVPVLIALVKDRQGLGPRSSTVEDRQALAVQMLLRDTAIGALVEIGDQSAVRPLLDSVAFRDHEEMGKLVAAIASLGGDEARRYLQFVRSSHPESAIRAEAEEALTRLNKHESAAAPPPSSK